MSHSIYGWCELRPSSEVHECLQLIQNRSRLGIFVSERSMMFGLPEPPGDRTIFCFDIGDSKDNSGAEWLLEEWDIDPAAPTQIPATKTDRVELVCDTIDLFLEYPLCTRVVFCATVCNEVDAIKLITPDAWRSEFTSDCKKEYPPCVAYDISR